MVELDLEGRVVTLAVAQKPFDKEGDSGVTNTFSTLVPVVYDDGGRADPYDFPAKQDVWWMIRSSVRGLADPGRLVTGTLERSQQAGHPDKAHYQVRVESVEAARSTQLTEILELLPDEIGDVRQLASQSHPLKVDHPPLDQVFVRWRGSLYGPLRTTASPARDREGMWLVQLAPAHPDSSVLQLPDDVLGKVPSGRSHRVEVDVSLNNYPTYHRFSQAHLCRYFLIPREDFQAVLPAGATRLVLENEQAVINRAAKKVFSRKKRQDLIHLLADLDGALGATSVEATEVIRVLKARLGDEEKEADALARALLESGAVDDRLRRAQEQAAQEHVEKHAALLQTRAEERVAALRKELVALEKRKEGVADEVEAVRRDRLAGIEADLEAKRHDFDVSCQKEREKLEAQARELDRQRELLSKNLAKVSDELAKNRDELVNQFLAISPLLSQLNLFAAPSSPAPGPSSLAEDEGQGARDKGQGTGDKQPARVFSLPAFVQGGAPGRDVREVGFFERFCKHVEASGFKHRRLDLAAFHLSVKCNDLTVLGGLPGTGKSSLPRLYAEALAGDEYEEGLRRYLHVGVSPSWLDMRDVLGHTNALDRCFQPAESGLYQHLVCAQEEEKHRGADSRLYFVCLDEMNLAQVEHYFSGFIQALERPHAMREVRCFSPEMVAPSDPFAAWPTLNLPRTLRFVGTVNFDETTRQLSQRVLDRANLIRLHPSPLLDAKDPAPARAIGPVVTLRNYRDWIDPSPRLDRSLGELIDKLREPLHRLGCPLNPRRFNAIRKFVGSAPPEVAKPEQSLDLQIAQRVLPQVRNLFRPGAQEALDAIKKTLEAHPFGFPESLQSLEEMGDSDYPAELFAEGAGE
jgi:hypothetical protein